MDRQRKLNALLLALAAPALAVAALPGTPTVTAGLVAPGPARTGQGSPRPLRLSGERPSASASTTSSPRNPGRRRCPASSRPSPLRWSSWRPRLTSVRTILGTRQRLATGAGSGVVIHPRGLIVTNYHVVEGAQNIRVSFEGEPESYVAELMSFVREEDLALLKIRPDQGRLARPPAGRQGGGLRTADARREFPTVRLGTSADLMPGERVVAIGSPHGQAYTVSTGIISGLHRDVSVPNRNLSFRGLIQTDASINLGNSGRAPPEHPG